MKKMTAFLLTAAGLILLTWAILILATPEISYQTSVRIGKPAADVYRFLADYANAPRWLAGLTDVQVTGGTPGTKGSTARYTFVENGRTAVFDEEVLAVEPGKFMEFRLKSHDLTLQTRCELLQEGSATVVSMHNGVTPLSFIVRAFLPFMKGMMYKRQAADLARLKELLEQD